MPEDINHTEQQQLLYETRSEEVQEIMGRMPSWIIRRGISVIGIIIIVLFLGSNFIYYPEKLTANVSISSDNPAVTIISPGNGRIQKIFVRQNDSVSKDNVLVVLENTAQYDDVVSLKNDLNLAIKNGDYEFLPNKIYQLGELQSLYSELLSSVEAKRFLRANDHTDLAIKQIQSQINQNDLLISQMKSNENIQNENYLIDKKVYEADNSLFEQKMLTENDYLQAKKKWLDKQATISDSKNKIIANTIKKSELNKSIIDIKTERGTKTFEENSKIDQQIKKLLSQIEQWELKYVIKSPVSGRVNLYSFWKENQYVRAGEGMMIIVPPVQHIVAKGTLPVQSSGRIKVGQTVMISLISHPHNDYGYIKGKISFISNVPMDSVYAFDMDLPDGLKTTTRKLIVAQPQLYATGEIFTDDKTLLQRLLNKVYAR